MSSNAEIEEMMKLQSEDPRKAKPKAQQKAESSFDEKELKEKVGEAVWVKCVSHDKPWAAEKPMEFWQDYKVPVAEAILLDERRFAVILKPSKGE